MERYLCPQCKASKSRETTDVPKPGQRTVTMYYDCGSKVIQIRDGITWHIRRELKCLKK